MYRFLLTFIIFYSPILAAFENGDAQHWNGLYLEKLVNESTEIYISEMVKLGENVSDLFLHRTDLGIKYEINNRIKIAANYKTVNIERAEGWQIYNSPYSSITLCVFPSFITVENRHQLEYWFSPDKNDYGKYRNRIKIIPQFDDRSFPFSLYVAEEAFIELNSERLRNLRTYLGVDFELFEKFEAGIYYCLHQTDNDIGWKNAHVLGTSIKLSY